jgi:hypothetical protein
MLPVNATMSPCAEGISTQIPYSVSPNCTRTFSWLVNNGAVNYDLMFMSRDNYTIGSTTIQFQINIIPPRPVITSITPTTGMTAGGGTITITGNNFGSTLVDSSITIGGSNCINPIFSVGNILCTVPAGQGVNVTVTANFNGRASLAGTFYSYLAPVINAISPTGGAATTGGQSLTLSGTNFGISGQVVTVNGIVQTPYSCTHDTCIVFLVASTGGANKPVVLTVAGQSNSIAPLFTWSIPILTSVSTTSAPTTGGGITTITGFSFGLPPAVVTVTIGGSSCPVIAHDQVRTHIFVCLPLSLSLSLSLSWPPGGFPQLLSTTI